MKRSQDETQLPNETQSPAQPAIRDDRPWQDVLRERLGDISWERISNSAEKK